MLPLEYSAVYVALHRAFLFLFNARLLKVSTTVFYLTPTNLLLMSFQMTTRPGYTGALTATIAERIEVMGAAIHMPDLKSKFPHLSADVTTWRVSREAENLAAFIDHTVLKANAQVADVETLCEEAKKYQFKAVCVNGYYVEKCKGLLAGTNIGLACVVGFPLGQMTSAMKAAEAADAISHGATEIDMVMNVGAMKDKNYQAVYEDIKAVKTACGPQVVLKVIFETCLLTEEQILDASILSVAAGAEYVKTSTGFSTGGATPEAIDIMLAVVGKSAKVKASGGVRDRDASQQYVSIGVERIGTSSGIAIVTGGAGGSGY